jgi:hypothetical protein
MATTYRSLPAAAVPVFEHAGKRVLSVHEWARYWNNFPELGPTPVVDAFLSSLGPNAATSENHAFAQAFVSAAIFADSDVVFCAEFPSRPELQQG